MELHRVSGRSGRGFGLALITVLLWSLLPFALELLLQQMNAATITWYRFTAAGLFLGIVLRSRNSLPRPGSLGSREWGLLAVATLCLGANYLGYLVALDWTEPSDAVVLVQLAPLLLALGGIAIFRENFTGVQWLGFAALAIGLAVFTTSQQSGRTGEAQRYLNGYVLMGFAAIAWAVYGLAQKQLLRTLPSQAIMLCINAGCALLFLPIAELAALGSLDTVGLLLLAFCALNTIVGYGAFSEALEHWEASRVSAVLALTPLFTIAFGALGAWLIPEWVEPRPLSGLSLAAAAVVVLGSLGTTLGAARMAGDARVDRDDETEAALQSERADR